jgi:sulfite exporter TauE/SafE/copper chaperone CopZ
MGVKGTTLHIGGMSCSSCKARIERALKGLEGVALAEASLRKGSARIEYDENLVSREELKAAVEKAGYAVKDKGDGGALIAMGVGLLLAAGYLVASSAGLFDSFPKVDASISYGMLFVVGLLTSVHCVAMCGGLALSQGSGSGSGAAAPRRRLAPSLLYNAGRILSYSIIGGLAGALGSALNFSPAAKGILAGAAGLFMVYLALSMIGLLPALPRLGKGQARLGAAGAGKGPFVVGFLNGLMPCGPLQTMQLYALGTGSFLAGALSMLLFAAGTVPLMLGFGAIAAILPRRLVPSMVRASAVLVLLLGFVTLGRAASLAGLPLPSFASKAGAPAAPPAALLAAPQAQAQDSAPAVAVADTGGVPIKAKLEKGGQAVVTEFKYGRYVPFVVQAGVPLKWTIRVAEDELTGCNNPLVVPAYGIQKTLVPGDNLVEFTPKQAGLIAYSCWMGMVRSQIRVVPDLSRP